MAAPQGNKRRATQLIFQLLLPLCIFLSAAFRSRRDLIAYADFSKHRNYHGALTATNHTSPNSSITSPLTSNTSNKPPQHAYAFLVAGCNPDDPRYRGFLYNIIVAIYSLWSSGSNAEYVIMIQMAANAKYEELPAQDVALFSKFTNNTTVHLHYLPKPKLDSFYQAMMSKFAVLSLTKFSRVLFLDADVMPLCNLDYIFELSERGVLKENVVIATGTEPANGGFFMLRPDATDYQKLLSIVQRQHDHAIRNSSYAFDYTLGWGHVIEPPDEWVTLERRGQEWYFHGSFADQGLLYHWVKYEKKNVSIVLYDILQNWAPHASDPSNDFTNNARFVQMEWNASTSTIPGYGCPKYFRFYPKRRPSPYKDFVHFSGSSKPWERREVPDDIDDPWRASMPIVLWFYWLRKANREFQLNINVSTILIKHQPLLGRFPILRDMVGIARADANVTR